MGAKAGKESAQYVCRAGARAGLGPTSPVDAAARRRPGTGQRKVQGGRRCSSRHRHRRGRGRRRWCWMCSAAVPQCALPSSLGRPYVAVAGGARASGARAVGLSHSRARCGGRERRRRRWREGRSSAGATARDLPYCRDDATRYAIASGCLRRYIRSSGVPRAMRDAPAYRGKDGEQRLHAWLGT